MGRRGPLPKPTAVRIAEGNPGRKKIYADEPKPKIERPICPRDLSVEAKREWKRIVPELLASGLVAKIDRMAVAAYCEACALWWKAKRNVEKLGEIVKVGSSDYPQQNPWFAIKKRAYEEMRHFWQEFGISPAARTRIRTSIASADVGAKSDKQKLVDNILDGIGDAGYPISPGGKA